MHFMCQGYHIKILSLYNLFIFLLVDFFWVEWFLKTSRKDIVWEWRRFPIKTLGWKRDIEAKKKKKKIVCLPFLWIKANTKAIFFPLFLFPCVYPLLNMVVLPLEKAF